MDIEMSLDDLVKEFNKMDFEDQKDFLKAVIHVCCDSEKMPELIAELTIMSLTVAKIITDNDCNIIESAANRYYQSCKNVPPHELVDMFSFN